MNNLTARVARLGFDRARFGFALRTGLAVCLAIGVAWALGLEHPQWAGMTVWAASLPTRGQLLAKSGSRLVGTLLGSLVGVAIVTAAAGQIPTLVIALSVWVAACVAMAHLLRGFVTYGAMLAGYSAALVALVGTAQHADMLALGIDRVLTALTGVLMALLVAWYFTPRSAEPTPERDLRLLAADTLVHLNAALTGTRLSAHQRQELMSRMAALDALLEMHGVSRESQRRQVRLSRLLLVAMVSLLIWRQPAPDGTRARALIDALERAIGALETGAPGAAVLKALQDALEHCRAIPSLALLQDLLERYRTLLERYLHQGAAQAPDAPTPHQGLPLVLHRDWIGAYQASVRALVVMLAVGGVWWASGSDVGAYMLLGTAVMTSLFSTFDSPVMTMRSVFIGHLLGAAGALACHWLVWPLATSATQQVLLIFPFVGLGIAIFAHRRLAAAAFDYNMVLLLLLQPIYPLSGSFLDSLLLVLGVLCAPLIGMAAYRLIYPVSAARRIRNLQTIMVHEIEGMAPRAETASSRLIWRARVYHRLLQLVRWADLVGNNHFPVVEWGLTILRLERVTRSLHALLAEPTLSPRVLRAVRLTLARIERLSEDPAAVQRALATTSARLERHGYRSEAGLLGMTATLLLENLSLFRPRSRG